MRKRHLFIITGLLFSIFLSAQENPAELVTDRPDQTESSVIVPFRSLQIETGFITEQITSGSSSVKSYAYNTTLLRYGLLKNLELRMGLEYLGNNILNVTSGFGPLYTGFKMKIQDENGWKPDVAFLAGLNFPFTAGDYYKPENTAAAMRFAFAHTLSESFSLGYNLGAEWNGESAVPAYFYSLALGIGLTEKLGMFAESFGSIPENGVAEHMLDAGFTFLLLSNLQIDLSGGVGLNDAAPDYFISFGLSYRLPELMKICYDG